MSKRELYDVQKLHASVLMRSIDEHRAALDGSETGCGKTLVAAEIAAQYRRPTLVIAPKSSLPMWKRETKVRGWPAIGVINYEMLRTGNTPWGEWVDQMKKVWKWSIPADTFLIWDEVQNCQGMNTQNGRMFWTAKPYYNLALSATAAEDPTEMKALGYVLGLHSLRGFWSWAQRHGCRPGTFGGLEFSGELEDIDKLHRLVYPSRGSRLTTVDLKDHFTETQIITTPIDFGDEIKEIYSTMDSELKVLAETVKQDSRGAEALTIRLRARQRIELLKVPVMLEMAENLLKEKRSVAIFVNFDATLESLRRRLSQITSVGMISGRYAKDRQQFLDDFAVDKIRVMLCNVQAGGVSVNLHDQRGEHPRTAIISPSDNAKQIMQCLGRVHRAGGATPSQQHILFAAGTIEEEVERNCRSKIDQIKIFNEGLSEKDPIISDKSVDVTTTKSETKPNENDTEIDEDRETNFVSRTAPATPISEPAHAEFSPSSLSNFEKCPGFRNRSDNSTLSSERGTRIHKALESDELHKLPEDERGIAQVCKDFIDSDIVDRLPLVPQVDRREVRLDIDLGGGLTTFGTCDRLLIYGSDGLMYDFKSGYREVADAEVNAQAWSYVIGAFQRYPNLQTVTFTFLVPNRDEVLYHTFKREDIPNLTLRLNTIIRRAMSMDWSDPEKIDIAKLAPQPELCEYCMNQAICPALAAKALLVGGKLKPGLPVPKSVLVSAKHPEDIPHLLRLAPLMEEWAKGVRRAALKLQMEEGVDIAGFKRIERATDRSVNSVLGAWNAVKDKIPLEDFLMACGSVSVPDLEDFFASKAKRNEKGKARQDLECRLRAADVMNDQGTIYYLKEAKR